jgi:23S rRNA (adenine2503-C2)-methyltransferase
MTGAPDPRRDLIGLSRDELAAEMAAIGAAPFRARQLWHWLYHRGATDFAAMTTLAKSFRAELERHYRIGRPAVARGQASSDGTRKWLLRFGDGQEAECVHIPEEDRGTLCVSSQVGCTLNCRFCHTGTQRLVRNLDAGEIVGQIMLARDQLGEWPGAGSPVAESRSDSTTGVNPSPINELECDSRFERERDRSHSNRPHSSPQDDRQLTNIVLMGMGEPLYNYDNVAKAVQIAMDHEGLSVSKRKITLSTAGVVPMIRRCGEELGVNLAISLHATNDELRDELVPLNKKYPLADLLEACRQYPGAHNARRITFEYVMLKDVNDSPAEARELVRLLAGIPAKVNLIPFNPWPGAPYECSSDAAIQQFSDVIFAAGYSAPVRTPRGRDILAACGQLKSDSIKKRRSERALEIPMTG